MDRQPSSPRPGLAIGVGIAFVAITVAAAFVFTNRQGSARIAQQGSIALNAEAALSAATAVRNGAAQAVLVQAAGGGVADVAPLIELAGELDSRLTALDPDLAEGERARIDAAARAFSGALERFIAAVDDGGADTTFDALDSAYDALVTPLTAVRDGAVTELSAARDQAGRVADAARFFVAFFLPLGAVLAYRRRMKREQERTELEQELAAQREIGKAKDEFIANLSHELRTPLTGIYGFALALESDGLEDSATARELTGLIVDESAELNRMVDDLIAIGRLEGGHLEYFAEPFQLKPEIDSVVAAFSRSSKELQVSLADGWIYADPGRVRQLLRNLISNAVKHGGPTVEITGVRVEDAEPPMYRVEVADDGDGVPDHVAERLFERYVHRGEQPLVAGSVGLGLAIARSFAEGMGGTLRYERKLDWTLFTLELPLVGDEGATPAPTDP